MTQLVKIVTLFL